jgi:hypothetical protein
MSLGVEKEDSLVLQTPSLLKTTSRQKIFIVASLSSRMAKYFSGFENTELYFSYCARRQNRQWLSQIKDAEGAFDVEEQLGTNPRQDMRRYIDQIMSDPLFASHLEKHFKDLHLVNPRKFESSATQLATFLKDSYLTEGAIRVNSLLNTNQRIPLNGSPDNVLSYFGLQNLTVDVLASFGYLNQNKLAIIESLNHIIHYQLQEDDILNLILAMFSTTEYHDKPIQELVKMVLDDVQISKLWIPETLYLDKNDQTNLFILALLHFMFPVHKFHLNMQVNDRGEFEEKKIMYIKMPNVKSLDCSVDVVSYTPNCTWR